MSLDRVYLVLPSEEHEAAYINMMNEWINVGGRIYPGVIKRREMDYITWLNYIKSCRNKDTCPSGYVSSDTYFLINSDEKILGAISIRHYLNDDLLSTGGHIGYGIRPAERKKGYAKMMLKMALEKCKEIGIKRVLVTCDKDNIASARTILANGGILENEVIEEDGNIVQRYWINVPNLNL